MPGIGTALARWARRLNPTEEDLALSTRSLVDTMAVALAARDHSIRSIAEPLSDAGRWSTFAHVLDFDDLHLESTTHISAVCVPTTLATGGDARAYLAGAGVMARLGTVLGWQHYSSGWHATCTAGAPAAAVSAGISLGLTEDQLAQALALAVPGAGGVQGAFGTTGKSLQVGFAADSGLRAARLVASGASADPAALDQWIGLVGGDPARLQLEGPAVPGGLAVKKFPCCYALQRPISAVQEIAREVRARQVVKIVVRTPEAALQPLIHNQPKTGLEGKFSLRYAIAATLLDTYPGLRSFTDAAVARPEAKDLMDRVEVMTTATGRGLLDGELHVQIELVDGTVLRSTAGEPPGSPARPLTEKELAEKIAGCGADVPALLDNVTWGTAAESLRTQLPDDPAVRSGTSPATSAVG